MSKENHLRLVSGYRIKMLTKVGQVRLWNQIRVNNSEIISG